MINSRQQAGSTLGIALIFLLLLTLIGTAAIQGSSLQERMAGNLRDRDLAFQAAEAALREGERFLQNPVLPPFNSPQDGLVQPLDGALSNAMWSEVHDWDAVSATYSGDLDNDIDTPPRYVIEELPLTQDPQGTLAADEPLPEIQRYRLTARAVGGTDSAVVILQTTVRR